MSNKKNVLFALALTFVALALPGLAQAQQGATVQADVSVTVEERAITLEQLASLSFGTILAFGRDGVVTVTASGNTSVSNVFSSLPGAPGTFRVTGVPNAPYTVTFPADNSVTVSNGTESMTLRNFSRTGGGSQLFMDGSGEAFFNVGATLNVNSRQAGGVYSGTYNVTVDYN